MTRRVNHDNAYYASKNFVGKSLVRIQTDKKPMVRSSDSDVYDKWAQALSSAVELATSACESAKFFSVSHFYTAVVPIVVVPDDLLWKVIYEENGNVSLEPAQVNECELFVGRSIEVSGPKGKPWFQQFTFSHVHFLTLTGFSSYLSKMIINDHAWNNMFAGNAVEL